MIALSKNKFKKNFPQIWYNFIIPFFVLISLITSLLEYLSICSLVICICSVNYLISFSCFATWMVVLSFLISKLSLYTQVINLLCIIFCKIFPSLLFIFYFCFLVFFFIEKFKIFMCSILPSFLPFFLSSFYFSLWFLALVSCPI